MVTQLESEPESNQIGEIPEEVPFVIPEKWKWAKLSDVAIFNPKVAPDDELEATFLPMAAVSAGYENKIDTTEIHSWRKIKSGYSKFADGDIIMAKITPCFQNLKSAICKNLCNGIGAGSTEFHVIRPNSLLNPTYLLIFLKSPYLLTYGIENFKGTAGQQRVGTNDLKKCLIPLPPLEEQKRIVACVENLRSHINSYQNEEQQLSALQSSFKEKLRASILQEAIQGKLVPQLESEPKVTQSGSPPKEVPFSIPDKWKWCQIGELATVCSARRVHKCDWKNEGIPFYRAREIAKLADNGFVKNELFITEDLYQSLSLGNKPEEGDLMITAVGTLGKVYVVRQGDKFYYKDASVICLKRSEHIYPDFARILFLSPFMRKQIRDASAGTTVGTITIKRAMEYWIPLPPVEEQRRIARAIKSIFQYIDNIKI